MADSGENSTAGRTFTTTSRDLWLQTRVLLKMQGISCGERYITDHGGLGTNPIWRLQTREPRNDGQSNKLLRVKAITRDNLALPCFDFETDDHFVWLPEADWTTSQCDDYTIVIGGLLMSVGHRVKIRVIQTEGEKSWNHVYLMTPADWDGAEWKAVDCSMAKPVGWEAPGASQVAATGKPAGITVKVKDYEVG